MKIPFFSGSLPALKGPEDRMTLRDHLAELRVRIVRSMLAVTLGVIFVSFLPVLIKAGKVWLTSRRETRT